MRFCSARLQPVLVLLLCCHAVHVSSACVSERLELSVLAKSTLATTVRFTGWPAGTVEWIHQSNASSLQMNVTLHAASPESLRLLRAQVNEDAEAAWNSSSWASASEVVIDMSPAQPSSAQPSQPSSEQPSSAPSSACRTAAASASTTLVAVVCGTAASMLALLSTSDAWHPGNLAFLLLLAVLGTAGLAADTPVLSVPSSATGCSPPSIRVILPPQVETLCLEDNCFPVLCDLDTFGVARLGSLAASKIPSANPILFNPPYSCELREPGRWREWVHYHWGDADAPVGLDVDWDEDGLVNILEYYAANATLLSNTSTSLGSNAEPAEFKRAGSSQVEHFDAQMAKLPISAIGSSPLLPDTDGDKLVDGFEFTYQLMPTQANSASEDWDGDGLTLLQEQIHGTSPWSADTDGDGMSDAAEVEQGSDPLSPGSDSPAPTAGSAEVMLTIGDHSGSESERYVLTVGGTSHQAPGFGVVGRGTYAFRAGRYPITITHTGSNLPKPDYDYTALVQKVSGNAQVTVYDPQNILGRHGESSYFFAKGKTAEMEVATSCAGDVPAGEEKNCECSELTTCEACTSGGCVWSLRLREACSSINFANRLFGATSVSQCPCTRCQNWYNEEIKDTRWLQRLNEDIKCPCSATYSGAFVKPVGANADDWETDIAANPLLNLGFHPGADGCIRSTRSVGGAKQQCCYNSQGAILPAGSAGAGTPDKRSDYFGHQDDDVDPYNWCCDPYKWWYHGCDDASKCQLYINGVRKGDTSHCT